MHSLSPSSWLSQMRRISKTIQTFFWPQIWMITSENLCREKEGINVFPYHTPWIPVSRVNPVWIHIADSSRELPAFWKLLTSSSGGIWCPTSQGGALPTAPKVKQHPGKVPEKPLLLQNRWKDVPQLSSKAHFSLGLIIHEFKDSNTSQLTPSSLESLL